MAALVLFSDTAMAWEVLPAYKARVEQLQADLQRAGPAQQRAIRANIQAVKMEARHVQAHRQARCKIVFVRPARARA